MEYIKPQMGDVLVNVAQVEEFENCNWSDAASAVTVGAGIGAGLGCIGGGVAGVGAFSIPGCAGGAVVGGSLGGLVVGVAYTASCWW